MFKSRLKPKHLFRRTSSYQGRTDDLHQPLPPLSSSPSPASKNDSISELPDSSPASTAFDREPKTSRSFSSLRDRRKKHAQEKKDRDAPVRNERDPQSPHHPHHDGSVKGVDESSLTLSEVPSTTLDSCILSPSSTSGFADRTAPELIIEQPTPSSPAVLESLTRLGASHLVHPVGGLAKKKSLDQGQGQEQDQDRVSVITASTRKPSVASASEVDIIKTLLQDDSHTRVLVQPAPTLQRDFLTNSDITAVNVRIMSRKVWVKRPNAAATIVLIREDDLVDEAKEAILRKYGNQLGRHFDAPDVTIHIINRGPPGERVLNPDETLCQTIDTAYPGGQTVGEALVIDVPPRRTPRSSPRAGNSHNHQSHHYHYHEDGTRPHEDSGGYFPQMPAPPATIAPTSPLPMNDGHLHDPRKPQVVSHERAMSVLQTGQVPPLPSPGALSRRGHKSSHRPNYPRNHTASPTTLASSTASRGGNRPRLDSTASADKHAVTTNGAAPLPTPPVNDSKSTAAAISSASPINPPTPRVSSPRPSRPSKKSKSKPREDIPAQLSQAVNDTAVPPINVLIVEDNMINMRLLEQFVRRLGVRWQTAVNGREAVNKWKLGGFHLVLMDIQLPIMSGLEATKEIRRLERVNNIGVFSSASNEPAELQANQDGDKLFDEEGSRLFKSSVIIVALTASNLQSDRHEALAAGCNDFLTKPVNFVWFERKVKEWGCMQALIDFDGWRKWKDFAEMNGLKDPSKGPGGIGGKPAKKTIPPKSDASKVPDPKTLDSRGLERVANGPMAQAKKDDAKTTQSKDFGAPAGEDDLQTGGHGPGPVLDTPLRAQT